MPAPFRSLLLSSTAARADAMPGPVELSIGGGVVFVVLFVAGVSATSIVFVVRARFAAAGMTAVPFWKRPGWARAVRITAIVAGVVALLLALSFLFAPRPQRPIPPYTPSAGVTPPSTDEPPPREP